MKVRGAGPGVGRIRGPRYLAGGGPTGTPATETRRCDSNPAQYERNRRVGHLGLCAWSRGPGAKTLRGL
ncbi:hypothetical protein JTE90_023411 [Oedothorax gibbosus]|uniref:Uncharacterized protein n=1 Tax=Oedothorax gibbosus TaxID=931172 RepID=A0AAV6TH00_9ARAC|nr:hypothetical protein JTE90_023411 [Oedothorax gibbosus]